MVRTDATSPGKPPEAEKIRSSPSMLAPDGIKPAAEALGACSLGQDMAGRAEGKEAPSGPPACHRMGLPKRNLISKFGRFQPTSRGFRKTGNAPDNPSPAICQGVNSADFRPRPGNSVAGRGSPPGPPHPAARSRIPAAHRACNVAAGKAEAAALPQPARAAPPGRRSPDRSGPAIIVRESARWNGCSGRSTLFHRARPYPRLQRGDGGRHCAGGCPDMGMGGRFGERRLFLSRRLASGRRPRDPLIRRSPDH